MDVVNGAAEIAPWHSALRDTVAQAIAASRLGQTILFSAPPGAGVVRFATSVRAAIVCRRPAPPGFACGHCQGCQLHAAGTHPDVVALAPGEPGGEIKVDQVRAFGQTMRLTPQYSTGRLGWIEPLDRLNRNAANSALKILEEPSAGSTLLAVTQRISAVPATIASRFVIWRLPAPAPEAGHEWLQMQGADHVPVDADGLRAPMTAVSSIDAEAAAWIERWDADLARLLTGRASVSGLADRAGEAPRQLWLDWLSRRVTAILRRRLGAAGTDSLPARLTSCIDVGRVDDWQAVAADVTETARYRYTNADWQLMIESVLLKIEYLVRRYKQ